MTDRIRSVVFDVGGVLVELGGVHVFREWTGNRMTPEEIWRRWLGSPSVRAFETGRISADVFADRLIDEFELPIDSDRLLGEFTVWPSGPFPGALRLVSRINRRFVRATLANTNDLHWDRFGEMGLAELFDHHFPSHKIGKLKPDADVFEHVVDALGCGAGEILFLDDQPINVEAARAAGFRAEQTRSVEDTERILGELDMLD